MKDENEELLEAVLKDLHKSTLAIPVLEEYKVIEEDSDAIFIAVSPDNSVEQYLEDGQLEENETFDQRLKKVLEETKESMKSYGLLEKDFVYLGEIKNPPFDFRLFLQDNIKDGMIVRQINAYFIEPESRYFYEITLSAPQMVLETVNEFVLKNLYDRMRFIVTNIKYNDSCPL